MSDYGKLIEDLKRGFGHWYVEDWSRLVSMYADAAAAIEALEAKISDLGESYSANLVAAMNGRLEPKRGKWIDDGTKYGIHWFKCSVCGESQDIPTVMLKPYYKYCPVCGAKMEAAV